MRGWPLGSAAYPGVRGSGPVKLPARPAAKSSRVVGLIEAELTATIGAAPGARTTERVTQRNGHLDEV